MDWILYLKAVILGIVEGFDGVFAGLFHRSLDCCRQLT